MWSCNSCLPEHSLPRVPLSLSRFVGRAVHWPVFRFLAAARALTPNQLSLPAATSSTASRQRRALGINCASVFGTARALCGSQATAAVWFRQPELLPAALSFAQKKKVEKRRVDI